MALTDAALRPACGASLEAIIAQVFEGEPSADAEHQAGCEHCARSLSAVRATRADMERFAAEPVAVPDLASRVLARLRRDQERIALAPGTRGATTVTGAIVGQVARRAAMTLPPVAFASVEVTSVPEVPAALTVRLVVVYGPALEEVAASARKVVIRAVRRVAGVGVGRVDVLIEDLAPRR